MIARMRVLHLTDRLTDRGGAQRHLLGVLEALAPAHACVLAAGSDSGHRAWPCPTRLLPGLEARTAEPVALEALAAELQPDRIHVHTVVNPEALEWAADAGAVITVQDHRFFCPARGKWRAEGDVCRETLSPEACAACFDDAGYFEAILGLTERRLRALRRFRAVVTLSRYMKQELAAAGVAPERVHVIPPFVHGLDPAAEADGPPCVVFVGRLSEAKGVSEAITAWRLAGVDLPLVVAGTGPLRAAVERQGIPVLGWLSRPRLSVLYRRARAVLMPSRWQEPFGIVGLEALTMGVPVVAWDSGGIAEWHPGEGLVPWGDLPGLARALRSAVGRRAGPLRGFDREPLMRRLLELYEETPPVTVRAGGSGYTSPS